MGVNKLKARINYKSRQIIIIMSIAVVLLIAAITGTVAFVKGNRNVAAAMKNENRQTVENSEDNSRTNISIADNGNLNNNETGNNSDNGKVLPNTGDNANPIDIGQNGNNGEKYLVCGENLSFRQFFDRQKTIGNYGQKTIEVPDWIMLISGRLGDLLRKMGIKTDVSTSNVRQLLVREYYSGEKALKALKFSSENLENAISDAIDWIEKGK